MISSVAGAPIHRSHFNHTSIATPEPPSQPGLHPRVNLSFSLLNSLPSPRFGAVSRKRLPLCGGTPPATPPAKTCPAGNVCPLAIAVQPNAFRQCPHRGAGTPAGFSGSVTMGLRTVSKRAAKVRTAAIGGWLAVSARYLHSLGRAFFPPGAPSAAGGQFNAIITSVGHRFQHL